MKQISWNHKGKKNLAKMLVGYQECLNPGYKKNHDIFK